MPRPKKTNSSIFAVNLTKLRKSKQMTQMELAERTGIKRGVIAYYETAATNPTIDTVQKFADIFEVEAAELIGEDKTQESKKPGPTSKIDVLFEKLKKLSPHKQRQVCKLIEIAVQN
jgi:transcriptional regulator with XRE-family HTH domain